MEELGVASRFHRNPVLMIELELAAEGVKRWGRPGMTETLQATRRSCGLVMKTFPFLPLLPTCLLLGFGELVAAELAKENTSLFSGSGNCVFCHDQWGRALLTEAGESVSITKDWRGTMMAHSFKDPLWRAVMEAETEARPELREFIEDKCQTCHAPMARTQQHHDDQGNLAYAAARKSELAGDGVSCTLCHQIQPAGLGTPPTFSGRYAVDGSRRIFGPYDDVLTMPMRRHVDYTPEFGKHVQDSGLCGTCHTLYTPVLNEAGEVVGEFPEQTPFLEWQASAFAREGTHCQDCHMERLDEPIQVSARPPWLESRKPFWRHRLVGGNTFMPALMRARAGKVEPNGEVDDLEAIEAQAREQLQRSARVEARGRREGDQLHLSVRVENLAGHKFPTGHPYRRAWLQVRVMSGERSLFESGTVDANGRLSGVGNGYAPHHDEIRRPEQVQVYESVMGDAAGERTYALLSAVRYLKDNRIPPRGFRSETAESAVLVRGVSEGDENFNADASGSDEVEYVVDLGGVRGRIEASVALWYQAVPPEAVERLQKGNGKASRQFSRFYRRADKSPELVQRVDLQVE